MNAVILTSVLSAGNSGMYASTRMLYSMSKDKLAFNSFSKTNKNGVPHISLIVTGIIVVVILQSNILVVMHMNISLLLVV